MSEYENLSLVELRVEARKLGIKSVTSYKKQELLDKVREVVASNTEEQASSEKSVVEKPSSKGRKTGGRRKTVKEAPESGQGSADPQEADGSGETVPQQSVMMEQTVAYGDTDTERTEEDSAKSSANRADNRAVSRKRKETDLRNSGSKREADGRTGGYKRENDNRGEGYKRDLDGRAGGYKRENDNRAGNYNKRDYDAKSGSYKKNPRQSYQNPSYQNQSYQNPTHQNSVHQNSSASRNYTSGQVEHTQSSVAQGRQMQNQNMQYDRQGQQGQKRIQDLSPAEMEQQDSGIEREGILEVLSEGYGFIRCDNFLPGERDIYVAPAIIRKYHLRTGDILSGNLRVKSQNEKFGALLYLKTVNGCSPDSIMNRIKFEKLTPIFPNERIRLETPGSQISMRMMDLISPIGKGQRGMIVSQPKTGKTTLLKQVAKAVKTNHPKMHLIVLLIDERPEEVTDIKESIMGHNVDVIYSTFDELPENHKRVSEMVIERAKRLVEHGQDVMILLDSITRLARAYNLTVQPSGRTLSGGLDPAALYMPKRFFGAARNMREGGSLTILATALVDTGSKMDDVVFEEFKGTGNMELVLDRRLSEKRVFPAIDLPKSSTRREDLLLTQEEIEANYLMRKAFNGVKSEEAVEKIIEMFRRTKNNQEFIQLVRKVKIV